MNNSKLCICGCGREPRVHSIPHNPFERMDDDWTIECSCGMHINLWGKRDAAIAAWNRAMSADLRDEVGIMITELREKNVEWSRVLANNLEAALKGGKP